VWYEDEAVGGRQEHGRGFCGRKGGGLGGRERYWGPSTAFGAKNAPNFAQDDSGKQTTARTGNDKNRQRQEQATARANAGILRCAQNDKQRGCANSPRIRSTASFAAFLMPEESSSEMGCCGLMEMA
jgi:hypothetical protein